MNELKIEEYILSHIDPEPELLKRMTREANVKLLRRACSQVTYRVAC